MATKRRRRSHKRRSRVGATSLNPKNPLILLASVAAGYLAGDQIYSAIDKMIPTKDTSATDKTQVNVVSDTMVGAGFAGVGALIALKGRKTLPKTIAGGVLAGAGIKFILKDQGVIKGFPSVPSIGKRRMSGFNRVPAISGIPNSLKGYIPGRTAAAASLNGIPNSLKGYTPNRMAAYAGAGY